MSGGQRFKSRWRREFLENSEKYLRCDSSSIKRKFVQSKTGMPSSSVGKVLGHQWLSRWLMVRRSPSERSEGKIAWKVL